MDDSIISTKIDLEYAEKKVCFSISDCSLDKKYSFWNINKGQAKKFIEKLKHFEKMTWKELSNKSRKTGLTPEKSSSQNFDLIHSQSTHEGKLIEQYYFHLRIESRGLFRVFGYQRQQFFCITHIDPSGKINH